MSVYESVGGKKELAIWLCFFVRGIQWFGFNVCKQTNIINTSEFRFYSQCHGVFIVTVGSLKFKSANRYWRTLNIAQTYAHTHTHTYLFEQIGLERKSKRLYISSKCIHRRAHARTSTHPAKRQYLLRNSVLHKYPQTHTHTHPFTLFLSLVHSSAVCAHSHAYKQPRMQPTPIPNTDESSMYCCLSF